MKARGNVIDPDELQLMDECNRVWVQSWKEATERSSVLKSLAVSNRKQENNRRAKEPSLLRS